jgi:hypothetical protein
MNVKWDSVGETGVTFMLLLGVYYDRNYQMLKRLIFVEIDIMQGEKIKTLLGQLEGVKVPIFGEKLKVN